MNEFNTEEGDKQRGEDNEPIQPDLFLIPSERVDLEFKNEMTLMEFPICSLSKNKDLNVREYSRGNRYFKVIPSVLGSATEFDMDLLIYAATNILKGLNENRTTSRRIRFDVRDFLNRTKRSTGGAAYERILDMCRRLKGTVIETNVKTTDYERTQGFSLLENYEVVNYTKSGKGALTVELTLSDWLYRSIVDYGILTINPEFFAITQPIERRLYNLARKHCGDKSWFIINVDLLKEKTGSTQPRKSFMHDLRQTSKNNKLPDYRLLLDESAKPVQAVFVTKNHRKLVTDLSKANKMEWYWEMVKRADGQASAA